MASTTATSSPFIVGVSGHRNVQPGQEAGLRVAVATFLKTLKTQLPHTHIRIMVGMAQGADLLVAQVAVEHGVSVDAVLPMPLDDYIQDFDASSAVLLKSLLGNALVECSIAPLVIDAGATDLSNRDALYANLTEILIQKSSLMLALWDGQTSPLPGGTADTLLRYLGVRIFEGPDQRQVTVVEAEAGSAWGPQFAYWIPTPRSDVDTQAQRPEARYLSGVGENLLAWHASVPPALAQQLSELDGYNREFERLLARGQATKRDSLMTSVLASAERGDRATLEHIDMEYGKADALAIHYQQRSDRLFQVLSFLGGLMAALFLVYAKLTPSRALLSTYLGVLAAGFALSYGVRRQQWFSKHLLYRVLAETMRSHFFLRVAGADRFVNVGELIHLSGVDRFAGFSWVGIIVKNVQPVESPLQAVERSTDEALSWVHHHWIGGQQRYFRKRVSRLEQTHERLGRVKSVVIAIVAGVAILLAVFGHQLGEWHLGTPTGKDVLLFTMGLLSVWLGVWELYENKMATRELLWQYRNQLSLFSRADLRLSRNGARYRPAAVAVLAGVGKDSLMESYLWAIHRYHREHEPPAGA